MSTFIKLKRVDGRLVLLDLSILEGFFERPGEPGITIAHYKAPYVMKGKDQEYIFLAHSVTEIANAIYAQSRDSDVIDLTMDEESTDSQPDENAADPDKAQESSDL